MPDLAAVLSESWRFYKKYWLHVTSALLVIFYAENLISFLFPEFWIAPGDDYTKQEWLTWAVLLLVFALVKLAVILFMNAFFYAISQSALVRMVINEQEGKPVAFLTALKESQKDLKNALAVSNLVLAKTFFWMLLLIPGLFRALQYAFSMHGVIVEGLEPADALERSKALVLRGWLQALGFFAVMTALLVTGHFLLAPLNNIGSDPENGGNGFLLLGSTINSLTVGAYTQISIVFYYLRLREIQSENP